VLSTGDPTGYGQHGDYVFGWKDDSLQKAMDSAKGCMGASCGGLKENTATSGNACQVPKRVNEDADGCKLYKCSTLKGFTDFFLGLTELPGMAGMPM
jgi:hypothetical protein